MSSCEKVETTYFEEHHVHECGGVWSGVVIPTLANSTDNVVKMCSICREYI
jgi:hypothetical protein